MRRGDVVLVVLQGDYGKPRPAVIVQGDRLTEAGATSIVVCPMTSAPSGTTSFRVAVAPTADNRLRLPSEVMVEKLAGVPRQRLREVVGRLDAATMASVDAALLVVLGFA